MSANLITNDSDIQINVVYISIFRITVTARARFQMELIRLVNFLQDLFHFSSLLRKWHLQLYFMI